MRCVLDASVAVKWVLPEHDTPKALLLRAEVQHGSREVIAPDTFAVEVAHALTRAERRGALKLGQAATALADVLSTPPVFFPFLSLLTRATELSSHHRIGVYDCLYLALGEAEGCDLVSADQRLKSRGFPRVVLLS